MMEKIKIAVFSMNHGHARGYCGALMNNPDFEWVAASCAPGYRDRVFLNLYPGIQIYDSDIEMLDAHPEIQAVVVASANYLHYEQFKLCIERGIHIYSMKVPTFNMEQYDEIIKLTEKNHITFEVELEMRLSATVRRVKELYQSGSIGKLYSMQATNLTHNPCWWLPWHAIPEQSYGEKIPLRTGDTRFRGGAMSDHPHVFDLVPYITGQEFDTVFAEVAPNIRPDIMVEDMITVIGKMKDGTVVALDPSFSRKENPMNVIGKGWEREPKRVEVNLMLHGEKGSIFADCFHPNAYHTGLTNHNYTVRYAYCSDNSTINMLSEFADCIKTGKTPTVNLRSHRNAIKVMNACYESVSTGAPVKII